MANASRGVTGTNQDPASPRRLPGGSAHHHASLPGLDVRALYMGAVTSMASSADGSSGQSGGGERTERSKNTSEQTPVADTGMIGYGRVDENDHTVAERADGSPSAPTSTPSRQLRRRWTDHRTVRLVLRARGEGALIIYRPRPAAT